MPVLKKLVEGLLSSRALSLVVAVLPKYFGCVFVSKRNLDEFLTVQL